MKLTKHIITAALIVAASIPVMGKTDKDATQQTYMFGFAASFNDTIVHFTDIQTIDSVWIDRKTNFLLGRNHYANQLRSYLTQQQMPHRTCIVFYDKKLNRLQNKFLKMKKLYADESKKNKSHNIIKDISAHNFKFTAVNMNIQEEQENSEK